MWARSNKSEYEEERVLGRILALSFLHGACAFLAVDELAMIALREGPARLVNVGFSVTLVASW